MTMKKQHIVRVILFRFLLPFTLLAAAVFRYNGISFLYLLLLLCSPLLTTPSRSSMRGCTGKYLVSLIPLSLLPVLGHIIFHVALVALATKKNPYGSMIPECSSEERLLRQIGFQRLDNANAPNIIRLIVPDVVVFITSVIVYVVCKRSTAMTSTTMEIGSITSADSQQQRDNSDTSKKAMLSIILAVVQNLALAVAGIMVPSALGSVYLLVFLVILTLWGCYKTTGLGFGFVRMSLLLYTGSHILVLYLYQFQFFQGFLDPSNEVARVIGLTGVIKTDCNDLQSIHIHSNLRWWVFVNPAVLLTLYWILAFITCRWRKEKMKKRATARPRRQVAEKQVEPNSAQAPERLVESEIPLGGQYGGTDNQSTEDSAARSSSQVDPGPPVSNALPSVKRKAWVSFLILVIKQSYVLSLIAMMAWSIAYHSWLTFVLLLTACFLWMMPNSRKWCLRASPFILFYAEILILAQYVFCMNLSALPTKAGSYSLHEIGMKKFLDPCPNLLLQIFFTLLIVLSLRQFFKERKKDYNEEQSLLLRERGSRNMSFLQRLFKEPSDFVELGVPFGEESYDSNTSLFVGQFMWLLLCKYWILFCTAMLAVISLQEVVVYRIIYMILFTIFLLAFQLNFTFWRKFMYLFWWVVIIYSMLVLTVMYTYQFDHFHQYWQNMTGFNDKTLKDIGLEKYDTAGLFIKLLTPTIFVIIVILQVRYFHNSFLKISAADRYSASNQEGQSDDEANACNITEDEEDVTRGSSNKKDGSLRNWMKRKILQFFLLWQSLTVLLWRVGQIHVFKLVIVVIILVAVNEVSALTFVYVLLIAIFLPFPKIWLGFSHLSQIWTAIIVLAKMIFQLNLVPTDYWTTHCDARFVNEITILSYDESYSNSTSNTTTAAPTPLYINGTDEDNAAWFGLVKISTEGISLVYYERLYLLIMFLIAFESIIRYHQRQFYSHPHHQQPKQGIIFIQITRPKADESFSSCVKFFANYFFYKFGLECCFIMSAITVCVRVDAISVIYILLMLVLLLLSRAHCAQLWPVYKLILAIMLPVQFLAVLGFPLGACINYPWHGSLPENLGLWLYLPDYIQSPVATKLIADTLQLLLVCLQSFAFFVESKPSRTQDYGGGHNKDIAEDMEKDASIPVADFTMEPSSSMDTIKCFLFEYMFWVTMAIVFITGVSRINIFSLFYVIAVFGFMWYGTEFYLKPLHKLLKLWNVLVIYTISVMCLKTLLQLIGCVYINFLVDNSGCWVVQLFGVNCLLGNTRNLPGSQHLCAVESDDAGLTWDVVCFVFLLLQRRIYSSHYFRHVVDSLKAQSNLAYRGAEIINRIMIRDVNRQKEHESKVLVNIKEQMTALKIKQAKLKKDYKEPEEHFQAIRAGDYYLFDDKEEVKDKTEPTSLNLGKDKDEDTSGMNPLQVINTAHDQGAEAAVEAYKDQDEAGGAFLLEEDEKNEPATVNKIRHILNLILTVWYSLIDWLIQLFNNLSTNYRLVAKQLYVEILEEKRKILCARQEVIEEKRRSEESETATDVHVSMEEIEDSLDDPSQIAISASLASLDQLEKTDQEQIATEQLSNNNRFIRLLKAINLLFVSHSEILCYLLMILNQMVYGSLLSLPLPLMVFLWGMLSVPRPSKTFWVTVITYTEAVVVCKYLFQFNFFPWNQGVYQDTPFFPPRIIGIEKRDNYANMDIALLLALFLHRYILRKYGLWRDAADISADMKAADQKEKERMSLMPSSLSFEEPSMELSFKDPELAKKSKLKQFVYYVTNPFTVFFTQVTKSSYNATVDVYAPMFGCDFILFLVLVFGFSSFGPAESAGGGDVASYIQDNKIPVPFLVMLITQFIFIVIDRALFLRKLVLGKFIFQIILVIAIHIWMFFVLPLITKRSFYLNIAAQIWYFIKCIYFALSAYQIRCGYPNRILGNFLTKKYGYVNLFLFKGFLAIPFLLELRALMDWIWTDSTLAIGSWLQMEDIYANIFVLKCWREIEKKYPTQRSIKKGSVAKYVVGGLLLVVIIFIIWFPLVFFSFFNSVFLANPPTQMSMTIGLGGYQPLFKTTVLNNIRALSNQEYGSLKNHFSKDRRAYAFLNGFDASDVTLVTVDGNSLGIWGISPISQQALIKDLQDNSTTQRIDLTVEVMFKRKAEKTSTGELSNMFEINLREEKYRKARLELADLINGTRKSAVRLNKVFPRFLRLGRGSSAVEVEQLLTGKYGITYSNISLQLNKDPKNSLSEWWDLLENIQGTSIFTNDYKGSNTKNETYFITFNDRKAPESLSFLSGYGIIGLYLSFILLIGRLLRISTTNQYLTIMFRELPDVDKVMMLCLDLYLVREMKDFTMEEDLYAKLMFLYRSPDSMIKYTRQTIRIGNIKKKED